MDLLAKTLEISKIFNIKPTRSKGQNFLVKAEVYENMVQAAELDKKDLVLEVGPGLGFLTELLAKKSKEVIAIELDDRLADFLENKFAGLKEKNIKLIRGDVLNVGREIFSLVGERDYKIVANLPYNITSIFLRQFLSLEHKPKSMVLMLQKEVAERICQGSPDMSLLSLSVQLYGQPKILFGVERAFFWPAPEVDSAVIKIDLFSKPALENLAEEKLFFRLAKFGFANKRKMLKNNLSVGLKIKAEEAQELISSLGLNPLCRAEELSLKDWLNLFARARKFMV